MDNWTEVVAEAENTLTSASIVGDMIVGRYLKDARTQVRWYSLDGKFVRDVDFPGIGAASGFGVKKDHKETFYSFSSFATPPSTYRYDIETGESTLLRRADVKFDPEEYETKQVFYTSKDGTKVPMFICHRKGLEHDGDNPVLLYGYGGFNISLPRIVPGKSPGMDGIGWSRTFVAQKAVFVIEVVDKHEEFCTRRLQVLDDNAVAIVGSLPDRQY